MDRQTFHEALEEVWKVIRAANGYIDRQAPWALSKTDKARMGAVLRVLVDTMRVVATVLQPFMPDSMARMLDQLGVPRGRARHRRSGDAAGRRHRLPPPQGVFPRYVETRRNALMLIDSHCHLDYFTPRNCRRCWRARAEAGVGEMVTIGTTLAQSERLPAMAEAHAEPVVHRRRASAPCRRGAGARRRRRWPP